MIEHDRVYGGVQRPCFNSETLGDELGQGRFAVAVLHERLPCAAWRPLVGISSHTAYPSTDRIGKRNVLTPQKRFLTDVKAGKLASFTWITPLLRKLRSSGLRRRRRTVVGLVDRERSGREQVLGFYGSSSSSGMIGAVLRSRSSTAQRVRRLGLPRWVDRNFAVCEERLRFRTFSTRRPACCVLRKSTFRTRAAGRCGHARHLACRRLS